jgi:O-antigen ligase
MMNKTVEKTLSLFLLIGVPFTTLFLLTGSVTDPVNNTKLFAAGCVAGGAFAIAIVFGRKELWRTSRALIFFSTLFTTFIFVSAFSSSTPLTQNIYGVFGRQTGLVTYLFLTMVSVSAMLLRQKKSFDRLIWALLISGAVNVSYAAWAIFFGDFINWSNPYGNILGLFGNPNFVGAFLGMFIAGSIAFSFSAHFAWKYRIGFALLGIFALYEIKESHAIQGLVVTGVGLVIVGFYLMRSRTKGWIGTAVYSMFAIVLGAFSLAGALQQGPLQSLIYKTSVSLRGQYWKAGLNMGLDNPLTGVGMDSYGNYYRMNRTDYAATVLPGPGTVTNAAHNVVIDIFAYGGFPLLISYLGILVVGAVAVVKVTLRHRAYEGTFVALTTTWLAYQLQSIISINQVGLAIWGWVLTGALVGYEYSTREKITSDGKTKTTKSKELIFSPQLVGGIGVVLGALIAVPPLSADMKWNSALRAQSLQQVESALTASYLSPRDSLRMAQAIQLFENSKLYGLAYKYAKEGVEFSPDYFDAWRMLYFTTNSTLEDKQVALANMKRLDPHNPDVLK